MLRAIPGPNPSGENLRYQTVYDQIRNVHREILAHSPTERDGRERQDWQVVARICQDALAHRSKDILIAAWLTEAELALLGFSGLRDGIETLRGLIENFWSTLYPEMEDGDLEARVKVLEWVNRRLAIAVKGVSLTQSGLTWRDYEEMERKRPGRDRDIARRQFVQAAAATDREVFGLLEQDLRDCADALDALDSACRERFGDESPLFGDLREALVAVLRFVQLLLLKFNYSYQVESAPMAASDVPESHAAPTSPSGIESGGVTGLIQRLSEASYEAPPESPIAPVSLPKAASSSEPGEFTRLFSGGAAKDAARAPVFPPPVPPAPAASIVFPAVASPHLPAVTQKVDFTLAAPSAIAPGVPFELFIWAHESQERSRILARSRDEMGTSDLLTRTKGPFRIADGTMIGIRLSIPGVVIQDPEDSLVWDGESTCALFVVTLPQSAQQSSWPGVAYIHVAGVQIARISFVLTVHSASMLEASSMKHRKAFASYASADRDVVLARIQGIRKVAPDLEIFLDVMSLRSGQNWEKELWRVIPASDIFYLFWSVNARESRWVAMEWRCALHERGLEFIDPIPLQSPREAPPPSELKALHFNDWMLTLMKRRTSEAGG